MLLLRPDTMFVDRVEFLAANACGLKIIFRPDRYPRVKKTNEFLVVNYYNKRAKAGWGVSEWGAHFISFRLCFCVVRVISSVFLCAEMVIFVNNSFLCPVIFVQKKKKLSSFSHFLSVLILYFEYDSMIAVDRK